MVANIILDPDVIDTPPFVGVFDGHIVILSTANPVMTADAARQTAVRLIEAANIVDESFIIAEDDSSLSLHALNQNTINQTDAVRVTGTGA
jgi:hypothetical protein